MASLAPRMTEANQRVYMSEGCDDPYGHYDIQQVVKVPPRRAKCVHRAESGKSCKGAPHPS